MQHDEHVWEYFKRLPATSANVYRMNTYMACLPLWEEFKRWGFGVNGKV